jgi:5S rRNA maturation endonuclease (ribonuclease M5)
MQVFNVERFLDDFDIPIFTEGKNCQPGWLNIQCPFCDDDSNHGGFEISTGHYNCWRCGWHSLDDIVGALTDSRKSIAQEIVDEYSERLPEKKEKKIIPKKEITLPAGCGKMESTHRKYLIRRRFDPDYLEATWQLMGTKQYGDYKFRIIAPIYRNGIMVSYQGRDITNRSDQRYKACSKPEEVIHHKNILYGSDYVRNERVIVCEGITDVWRLGKGTVATFGTQYTKKQIEEIYRLAKTVFILYDFDAQDKADRLSWELSLLGIEVERVFLDKVKDPGDLKSNEAEYIRKELLNY